MKRFQAAATILSLLVVGACNNAADEVVDRPSNITLQQALTDTVDALYAASQESREKHRQHPDTSIGMNPCTLTATFNIAASGTSTTGISGGASTPAIAPATLNLSLSHSETATGSRGNQVQVTFNSEACNPGGTLGTTSPEKVVLLQREAEAAREGAADPVSWQLVKSADGKTATVVGVPTGTSTPNTGPGDVLRSEYTPNLVGGTKP